MTAVAYKKLTELQRLRADNELLKKQSVTLQREVEFLKEELRIERETQHTIARRNSYGNGYQQ